MLNILLAHLNNLDPFVIDLRVCRGQQREEEEGEDEGEDAVEGGAVGEPVDDAEGGPEQDGDRHATHPTLEGHRSQPGGTLN